MGVGKSGWSRAQACATFPALPAPRGPGEQNLGQPARWWLSYCSLESTAEIKQKLIKPIFFSLLLPLAVSREDQKNVLKRKLSSEHPLMNTEYGPRGTAGKGPVITGKVLRGWVTQPGRRAQQQAGGAVTRNTTWLLSIQCFSSP